MSERGQSDGGGIKTLYVIDGYAQFFRAYHAIRTPMTSPVTKEPTNLTFGFVGMLLKLLRGEGKVGGRPEYVAVALDVSGDRGTFRSQIDSAYKAHRPLPPEDLPLQVERCLKILQEIGVPVIGAEGYEADDVIATIAKAKADELRVRIVSKDKDLKQLLRAEEEGTEGGVEMYDVHRDELIDVEGLREETGLTPGQVVDMLALMGDTSDNIVGVEGVGPKTAAQLIAKYGSLEGLLGHADEIAGKRGEKIRAAADRVRLNLELVRLRDDVPMEFDLEQAATDRLELEKLGPILRELGFNRYQDELKALLGEADAGQDTTGKERVRVARDASGTGGLFDGLGSDEGAAGSVSVAEGVYVCVRTQDELDELVRELERAELIAVDTETTGLRPRECKLCGVSLAVETGKGWYVPVRSCEMETHLDEKTVLGALREVLEDEGKAKAGHNLKYDMIVLRNHGVELRGVAFDSMVASYLIDASRSSHSLDALAMALLGRVNMSIKDLIGSGKNQRTFDTVALADAVPYACEDVDVALQLREVMLGQLKAMGLAGLFEQVEMPLVSVLAELEWNGIRVDRAELDRQRGRLEARMKDVRAKIDDEAMAGLGRTFNPDSPKQLSEVLFNGADAGEFCGLGLRPIKKTKTGYSTDIEVLEKLAQDAAITTPIPELILENRSLSKLVGTYLVSLANEINEETGRIHASFNQTVAATGRLSSSDPNLQNIPIRTEMGREIRKAFVAPEGRVLISADYSQIELRLLAHLADDAALIEAFRAGEDIHRAVAGQIHGVAIEDVTSEQRSGAKMVNFGIVYGVTPYGLARRLGIGNKEAGEIIDGYKAKFAGITTFLQECIEQAKRHGYVQTLMGRRRPIVDIESTNPARRSMAERMAINSVVQGSAADLIKVAMVDLHGRLSEHAGLWQGGKGPEVEGVMMLLQIHDELVFEADEKDAERVKKLVVERMEGAGDAMVDEGLKVPIKVDASVAKDWFGGQ